MKTFFIIFFSPPHTFIEGYSEQYTKILHKFTVSNNNKQFEISHGRYFPRIWFSNREIWWKTWRLPVDRYATGSCRIRLEYEQNTSRLFCGGHFEFLIRGRSASARSGNEVLELWDSQIPVGSDRSPKIIKWQVRAPRWLRAIFLISVPDLALADRARVLKIQNGRHKTLAIKAVWSLIHIPDQCKGALWYANHVVGVLHILQGFFITFCRTLDSAPYLSPIYMLIYADKQRQMTLGYERLSRGGVLSRIHLLFFVWFRILFFIPRFVKFILNWFYSS